MSVLDLVIAGEQRAAEGGRTFSRRNPLTGEVATEAAAASTADATAAADAAAADTGRENNAVERAHHGAERAHEHAE